MDGDDSMFMTRNKIIECINGLRIKNTEGYDRIPQRILVDGRDSLIEPLTELFRLIYRDKCVPGQWLISRSPSKTVALNIHNDLYFYNVNSIYDEIKIN